MAVWKPENFVITNTGLGILSRIASGTGDLTITRISSGSGFIAPASLRTMTQLTNKKQDFTLTKKEVLSQSIVINIRLTNEGLSESYDLSQIGIFVTHPDFSGEKLYMVAQCEQGTADSLPLPDLGILSLNYSLSIAYSPGTTVNVNVLEADVALKHDVDEAVNNIHTILNTLQSDLTETDNKFGNLSFSINPTDGGLDITYTY